MPTSTRSAALELKDQGNDAFKSGEYEKAVVLYGKAIEAAEKAGEDGRGVYFLNRAQAYLKLERWPDAESDCSASIALSSPSPSTSSGSKKYKTPTTAPSSKAYWRRALARKEIGLEGKKAAGGDGQGEGAAGWRVKLRGAIDDYRKWHALAVAEKLADAKSVRVMNEEVAMLEKQLKGGSSTAAPQLSRSTSSPSVTPAPAASADSPLAEQLTAVHEAYSALTGLWANEKDRLITAWSDLAIKDVRKAKAKDVCKGVVEMGRLDVQREYPELRPDILATGSNLLDLISSRALRDPATLAFHLDHVRAATILKAREPAPPRLPSSLYGYTPAPAPRPEAPFSEYVQILPNPKAAYGDVVTFNAGHAARLAEAKKAIENGEACKLAEGRLVLERQKVLYEVALRAAKMLQQLNPDGEVDAEAVEAYEARVRGRDYAGRDEYDLGRVEETVKAFLGYAEDHLEFLRSDSEYVSDYVLDRMSPSVRPGTQIQRLLVKEEALQLVLNAYARQTLWKESLLVIADIRRTFPNAPLLGTSSSLTLPPAYARKIGLLAKLVDAFVDLAYRELMQSVEHTFETAFKSLGRHEEADEFQTFLDMVAQMTGNPHRVRASTNRNVDPLALAFRSLTKLEPAKHGTFQILACLNELNALFDAKPEEKSKLSRRLVEGLGEYAEAIELREMIVDSHLPRFNKDWADKSVFLSTVNPLWVALERCWIKSVTDQMAGTFIADASDAALQDIWTAFDRQCLRDQKKLPGELFDDLLSADPTKPASYQPAPASDESDNDDDGPPPLVEASSDEDDGPPPLVAESDSDSDDGPPPLVSLPGEDSSDDDGYATPRRAPQRPRLDPRRLQTAARKKKPVRRPALPREPVREAQPGPSSGATPASRRVDSAAVTDSTAFEIQQRERERLEAEERDAGSPRKREKVKTRKGPSREEQEQEWETTATESSASETETEVALPEGVLFPVARRFYDVWEQVLGGENVRRSEVAWSDFRQAMEAIGFLAEKGTGSRWKFHPRGILKPMGTIAFHEPHPASSMRVFQVHNVEARLKRRYGLHIGAFDIDTSRRDQARPVV